MIQMQKKEAQTLVEMCGELKSLSETIKDDALDSSGYAAHRLWVYSSYLARIESSMYEIIGRYEE